MNRQQLQGLLSVHQDNDYTWTALLPEMTVMWAIGHSEDEAIENWLQQYDQPILYPVFDSVLQERATHPRITEETADEHRLQRPVTVDFPYRDKLYRIETNEGLPKRHIVLPDGRVLVVCGWVGRVPAALADIRRSPELMSPHEITGALDGVLATEIALPPGQTTKAMAVLDFEGQRYAVDHDSDALVEFPDGRLYRSHSYYPEEPVRIADIIPFDPTDSYMPHQMEMFGTTPAIPVAPDYPGMAHEPRDLRIRFSYKGKHYILSHEAYEQKKFIVFVPDHGFFRIGIYLESMPVKLGDLRPLSVPPTTYENVAAAVRLVDAVDADRDNSDRKEVQA